MVQIACAKPAIFPGCWSGFGVIKVAVSDQMRLSRLHSYFANGFSIDLAIAVVKNVNVDIIGGEAHGSIW